ncbi:hypothetical protein Tco_0324996 [Tanacetum coccineum]
MDEGEDDEVTKELYDDVNVNLGNKDTDMTIADQGASGQQNVSQESGFEQVEEDVHVTLTPVIDTQKTEDLTQSSSVSSDFTSKLLNIDNPSPADNEIASLMDTTTQHATIIPEITSSFTTTTTTSLPTLPDFASVFKFNERFFNLEKDVSEIKQVDQYAQALSSIPALVDLSDFATPIIEKNVTELVEAAVLTRCWSQPTSTYEAAISLSEFKLTKILIDKMEKNKSYDKADYKKKLYDALVKSYNTDKDLFDSYSEVFSLKRSHDEDNDQDLNWISGGRKKEIKGAKFLSLKILACNRSEFVQQEDNDEKLVVKEAFNLLKGTGKSIMELEYHLEECSNAITERPEWHNPENKPYPFDLRKPLSLIQDHRGRQIIPKDYFINKDLEYLKGGDLSRRYSTSVAKTKATTYDLKWIEDLVQELWSPRQKYDYGHLEEIEVHRDDQKIYTSKEGDFKRLPLCMFTRWIVIQMRVEDLQLGVESYQKKLNLMKPDTFSDGTLDDVRSALNDIAKGIRMEYLPMRKWSNLDKKRARVMVQDIDKHLYQRRLMRNLDKFIGGREYENDIRLLERTISLCHMFQNRRDLPRDIPRDSVVVLKYEKRSKSEYKGRVLTKMDTGANPTRFPDSGSGFPMTS